MAASDRAPAKAPAACEPPGSLWAPAGQPRGVTALDSVMVRAPTAREAEELRANAAHAEKNSPFVDDVAEEVLRRPVG